MQVLEIISLIWKSGANIYLDPSDGRIGIKRQNLIPVEVMQAAEKNFNGIDTWFKSWKDANNEKIIILKIFMSFLVGNITESYMIGCLLIQMHYKCSMTGRLSLRRMDGQTCMKIIDHLKMMNRMRWQGRYMNVQLYMRREYRA